MDGREAMALAGGSATYYFHRGNAVAGGGGGGFHPPPGFRSLPNPNVLAHPNARPDLSGPSYPIEAPDMNFGHGMNIAVPPGVQVSEPVKKKRGRPRKYAPDGQVSLGLSPLPVKSKPSSEQDPSSPKRARGRPPGSGRKQQLALLGDWMKNSAGMAFSPHVIHIEVGEDIVAKILSFAQQRPRALCILSGTGTISSVTLRQPASSGSSLTFEGRFEILCLSGSYLVSEDGGPKDRSGGVSASLSSPDGHVVGGAIEMLIAAGPVQVVACSFVHGASKTKDKSIGRPKASKESATLSGEKEVTPKPTIPQNDPQNFSPSPMHAWPISRSVDMRNPHSDIDLMRG
ncbi:AT-hook motif nuclear-localized protein 5 [Mercurialis annua]|uniref:AT-hook motif nuclear-localized protein 5 n=1 Tax=Mercurialis annua TaxID=3986 RepID=UPI00215EFD97|nr:AT-hook motif nuclear-localized protein 5 [Mercurialis annua]